MKIRFIIVLISFSSFLYGQNEKQMIEIKEFISQKIRFFEPNPIYYENSKMIESLFNTKLTNFPNNSLDTCKIIKLLIDNSLTGYDDSQDSYRYSMRRFMIFSIFALSLSPDKADLYIDLAEKSLAPNIEQPDLKLIDSYSGFLVMILMIKESNKTLYSYDYETILRRFENLKKLIEKEVYDKGIKIIMTFERK